MLRLFDCLETDPNTLFQDSFRRGRDVLTQQERHLLDQYRGLSPLGRESVQAVLEALCAYRAELEAAPDREPRVIPLYQHARGRRLCGAGVRGGLRLPSR